LEGGAAANTSLVNVTHHLFSQRFLVSELGPYTFVYLWAADDSGKGPAGRIGGAAGRISPREVWIRGEVAGEIVTGVQGFKVIRAAQFLGDPEDSRYSGSAAR